MDMIEWLRDPHIKGLVESTSASARASFTICVHDNQKPTDPEALRLQEQVGIDALFLKCRNLFADDPNYWLSVTMQEGRCTEIQVTYNGSLQQLDQPQDKITLRIRPGSLVDIVHRGLIVVDTPTAQHIAAAHDCRLHVCNFHADYSRPNPGCSQSPDFGVV